MKYIADKNIAMEQLINLYTSVGWSSYTQNPRQLQKAVVNSLFAIGAYDQNQLVGLIRVVGDGLTIIYIQDLLVNPAYQRQGIGTKLINRVLKKYNSVRQKVLLTENTVKTRRFYESCNFHPCDKYNLLAFYKDF